MDKKVKILAIQHNKEGRPCGWGLSVDQGKAEKEAEKQWHAHLCYFGEQMGAMTVHEIEEV